MKFWRRLFSAAFELNVFKKRFVAPIYPVNSILNGLAVQLVPMLIFLMPFELCDMLLQLEFIQACMKQPIVPAVYGNRVVPHFGSNLYC